MRLDFNHFTVDYFQAFEAKLYNNDFQRDKIIPLLSIGHSVCGGYQACIEDDPLQTVGPGCYIVPAYVRHSVAHFNSPTEGYAHVQWCFLRVLYRNTVDITQFLLPPFLPDPDHAIMITDVIQDALKVQAQEDSTHTSIKRYELAVRLLSILFDISEFTYDSSLAPAIFPALQLIERRYAEDLTLSKLADACSMAPSTFSAAFRKAVGTSPGNYLIRKRLLKASSLMLSGKTLNVIARQVGFNDEYHLSRMFKSKYGMSPRQYKKNNLSP